MDAKGFVRAMPQKGTFKSVVVVGAGGNIGSHLVPHLGRIPGIGRVTLVDHDRYERRNVTAQNIDGRDVGRKKAHVQAGRLRRINPELEVVALAEPVESLPIGTLRSDVILACLDSRRSRQYVNETAWHLGIPWIDSGVDGERLLARTNVYFPGVENACLECAWDERDYANLEVAYPCSPERGSQPPTDAPSSIGALAASLQAIECLKLVDGFHVVETAGKEVLIDARHHKHYLTRLPFNPRCRLSDHDVWSIETVSLRPEGLTLGEALELGGRPSSDTRFRVEGQHFLRNLTCRSCGYRRSLLRLERSMERGRRRCRHCGGPMVPGGFDRMECLSSTDLGSRTLRRSLRSLGLQIGDVYSVDSEMCEKHFEITGDGA